MSAYVWATLSTGTTRAAYENVLTITRIISRAMFDLRARKLCITTMSELGAITPRVPWFGGTGLVSGAPQGWFKPRLRPKDFA